MQLAPYGGKSDLREYLAQFDHVCRGNGWGPDKGGMHLVAALCGVVAEVLTNLTPGAIMLANLPLALNNRFGID